LFNIQDTSVLGSRSLRDALEHFDERIDKYLLSDDAVGFLMPQTKIGLIEDLTDPVQKFFKYIDPVSQQYILFGETYDYREIAEELNRVFYMCEQVGDDFL